MKIIKEMNERRTEKRKVFFLVGFIKHSKSKEKGAPAFRILKIDPNAADIRPLFREQLSGIRVKLMHFRGLMQT